MARVCFSSCTFPMADKKLYLTRARQQVAADAKFVDLGADSLDTVEIMMALEEQFEITLDEEGAEKIATVQEAADMIQEQMA